MAKKSVECVYLFLQRELGGGLAEDKDASNQLMRIW